MKISKYVTVAKYCRLTGQTHQEVCSALEAGRLKGIKTRAGHWKVEISSISPEIKAKKVSS